MNSKERVALAFKGAGYDRLPMWYGAEPGTTKNLMDYLGVETEEELMRALEVDFRTIRPRYVGPPLKRYDDGRFETYWGLTRGGGFWGIALNAPLKHVESIREIDACYTFPDPGWFDVSFTEEDLAISKQYCIIGGMWSPFWHEAEELFGIERAFELMYDKPEIIDYVLERTLGFDYEVTRRAFEAHAKDMDVFWFANDFGTQNGLLIDPAMWRRFFKEPTRKLAELGHKYGLRVAMHSCGDVHQILPDLIECGIEIYNPCQPSANHMDAVTLKREYGKDLIFFGGIDVTHILPKGTSKEVRAEVRRVIDILGKDGRYIVAPSHDLMMEEIGPRNIFCMYDEAKRYSRVSP